MTDVSTGSMITRFLMEAGPLIFPLMASAAVVLVLSLWNVLALTRKSSWEPGPRRQSIDSVLFWGGIAAILGLLGQWIGIGRMARVVAERGIVSPKMVVLGLSESLLTPIAGMIVLVVAAFLWFFLRIGLWARERRT